MSGIKYYQLMAGDELPDEFCVVRDVNGEPEEYAWYEPMDSFDRELWDILKKSDWVAASEHRKLKAENAKLREQGARLFDKTLELKTDNDKLRGLVRDLWEACPADGYYCIYHCEHYDKESESHCKLEDRMAELGIEVDQ